MTEACIQKALYRHFCNYEYKLNNTFVFSWESDFFAQSKSGYFVECEVKISRSDFKKDFEKEKHKLFSAHHGKKTHLVTSWGQGHGDHLLRVVIPELQFNMRKANTLEPLIERAGSLFFKNGVRTPQKRFIVNDWDFRDLYIRRHTEDVFAPCSHIRIRDVGKIHCPHQFYYAVPEGLIAKEEVPPYAGLIYVSSGCVHVIKRAPYLHKRDLDLTPVLLKKYYNLWQYKVPQRVKEDIQGTYSEVS